MAIGGTGSIVNNTQINIDGRAGARPGIAVPLDNYGTLTKTGNDYASLGLFNNFSTVNVNAGQLYLSGGGSSTGHFELAAGTSLTVNGPVNTHYRFAPGTTFGGQGAVSITQGILDIDIPWTYAGSLEADYSSIINVNAGISLLPNQPITAGQGSLINLNSPSTLAVSAYGSLQYSVGTVSFNATSSASTLVGTSTVSSLGVITGAADLLIAGQLNLNSGTLMGSGKRTIAPGGTLSVTAGYSVNDYSVLAMDVLNNGTLQVICGGRQALYLNNGAVITNNGLIDIPAGSSGVAIGGTGSIVNNTQINIDGRAGARPGIAVPLDNYGTLTKTGNDHASLGLFNNFSTVNVNAGQLYLSGGGSSTGHFELAAGTSLTVNGPVNTHYRFAPGTTFGGQGAVSITQGILDIDIPWTYAGSLEADYSSVINVNQSATATVQVNGGTVNFNGNVGAAQSVFSGTANFNNSVTAPISLYGGTTTFNAPVSAPIIATGGLPTVIPNSQQCAGTTLTSGTWLIQNGATLSIAGGPILSQLRRRDPRRP